MRQMWILARSHSADKVMVHFNTNHILKARFWNSHVIFECLSDINGLGSLCVFYS